MADGPPPTVDEQRQLLEDVRAKRDIFALEKAWIKILLNMTLEKVKFYRTLLGTAESKLCTVEDLIGDIRFRLRQRGVPIRAIITTLPLPGADETVTDNNHPGCVTFPEFNSFVLMDYDSVATH